MYSRQESSRLKQEFWTVFGQYMSPVLSAEGEKINWINYRTGEKDIAFRMEADNKTARISIVLTQKDEGLRHLYFEQFREMKKLLEAATGEEWTWMESYQDESGKTGARIFSSITDVSIFRRQDWPTLVSFFKPRIMALDEFWTNARYTFEALR